MASGTGEDEVNPAEDEPGAEEESPTSTPWMPHVTLSRGDIDTQFPSLEAPDDEGLEDPIKDSDDTMLEHGMKIATKISENMLKYGRTRRDCLDGVLRKV